MRVLTASHGEIWFWPQLDWYDNVRSLSTILLLSEVKQEVMWFLLDDWDKGITCLRIHFWLVWKGSRLFYNRNIKWGCFLELLFVGMLLVLITCSLLMTVCCMPKLLQRLAFRLKKFLKFMVERREATQDWFCSTTLLYLGGMEGTKWSNMG